MTTFDRAMMRNGLSQIDGGLGSGNWGHKGRPGLRGGSGKGGSGHHEGKTNSDYYDRQRRRYNINNSSVANSSRQSWGYKGKATRNLPNGSGSFSMSRQEVGGYRNSIVPYLRADGSLTPDRQRLHDRVINDLFRGKKDAVPKQGEPKTMYYLGGGPASGKGSLTKQDTCKNYNMVSNKDVPTIDPDEFKKKLPEFATQSRKIKEAGPFAHSESLSLKKRAREAAFDNGLNFVVDSTGDGSVQKVLSEIRDARSKGYKVEARYVTAPIDVAIERCLERYAKDHRYVPLDRLIQVHKDISEIIPQVASEFDHFELYDTNQGDGKPGKLIAECFRGQPLQIKDKQLWKEFLNKSSFQSKGAQYYIDEWNKTHKKQIV